ncbi:MAG: sensor domain-containing diguanylate cyclase [Burkholderiaceae bacterium]|nr:MAG: sensor domain-containing diguanylate cyclase [Burkholderiaceae bacterium]
MKYDASLIPDILPVISDLMNVLPDAILMVDASGKIVLANDAVQPLLSYSARELVGQPMEILIPPMYRARHAGDAARFRSEGKPRIMGTRPVLPALNKAGDIVPVSISISNVDIRGERLSIAVVRDARAIRDSLEQASAEARNDSLTGMANRLPLSQWIQAALNMRKPFGILFLDLAKFKLFNDTYGHQTGDTVLRLVAERVRNHVRPSDLAVRFGGDEFVILLDGITSDQLLETRALAISASIAQPFLVDQVSGTIHANIGGALYPRDGSSESELLAHADRNMYEAKVRHQSFWI